MKSVCVVRYKQIDLVLLALKLEFQTTFHTL